MSVSNPESIFAAETIDDLQTLLSQCLELQEKPSENMVKELFRIMHSIKWNAQIVNFQNVSGLIHHGEEVLQVCLANKLEDHSKVAELIMEIHDTLGNSK